MLPETNKVGATLFILLWFRLYVFIDRLSLFPRHHGTCRNELHYSIEHTTGHTGEFIKPPSGELAIRTGHPPLKRRSAGSTIPAVR